jgi:hypothetical protein
MLCKGCGAEITDNQMFCQKCGTKNELAGQRSITKRCGNCGKEVTTDMEFCDACGGHLVPVQPNNQPNNSQNMVFPNQFTPDRTPNQAPPIPAATGPVAQQGPYMANIPVQNQMPPRPMPQYQMKGQTPPLQSYPNQMQPYPPVAPVPQKKKKSPLLPIFIVVGAVILLLIGVIGVTKAVNYLNKIKNQNETDTDVFDNIVNSTDSSTDGDMSSDNTQGDSSVPTPAAQADSDEVTYDMKYSYTELPSVVSIDSDSRFSYYNYNSSDSGIYYVFLFNDPGAAETDFYTAVNDYSSLLMNWNGYTYWEDFSQEQYNLTGYYADYYNKDIGLIIKQEHDKNYII